ncbi:hypothetical protein FOLKNPGA_03377 [Legionella sp. PC1000]|uniref:hypothetical protein n=1 Tax=Legionella sp. PC1000 TaxID=2746060 RepID=UPI0015FE6497|nr:hypothetical protein [Legionella sp. PC1000]QLZ70563.1 hypothetical protein FOLKNPGA_03377 [Legionella sp. PC1000]
MPNKAVQSDSHDMTSITHVKMTHSPVAPDWWTYQTSAKSNKQFDQEVCEEELAASQFAVAKYILTHPEYIVVHEGLSETWSSAEIDPEKEITQQIRTHFNKETFDKEFDELSPEQKAQLRGQHGAPILLYLGLLDTLYPSASLETTEKLVHDINSLRSNYGSLIDIEQKFRETREKEAIILSKCAADETGVRKVLLVYGGIHNLEDAVELLDDETIVLEKPVDLSQVLPQNTHKENLNTNLAVNQFNFWSDSPKKAFTIYGDTESEKNDDATNKTKPT